MTDKSTLEELDDFVAKLPGMDQLNELIAAMRTVLELAEELDLDKLPSIDELEDRAKAMRTVLDLADELAEERAARR